MCEREGLVVSHEESLQKFFGSLLAVKADRVKRDFLGLEVVVVQENNNELFLFLSI